MTFSRDRLSKSETVTVAAIEDQVPLLVEAREIIAAFHAMIRRKSQPNLDLWLDRARARRKLITDAPTLRQSQNWTPIEGQILGAD